MIFRLLSRLFVLSAAVSLVSVTLGFMVYVHYSKDLPDHHALAHYRPTSFTRLFTADGQLLDEYGFKRRIYAPISEVPKHVIDAFLSAEDKNFYTHKGVDLPSVLRALWINLTVGESLQGGSTITQQVVKNMLLTPERTIERKIREAILAYRISITFAKDRILEIYLNDIYFGAGAYGIGAAAHRYFNKSVQELSLEEGALLAALPKAPSRLNPKVNYNLAVKRRNFVIERMEIEGIIDRERAYKAKSTPIFLEEPAADKRFDAPYFRDAVLQWLEIELTQTNPYRDGLMVHTTLQPDMQRIAQKALRSGLEAYAERTGRFSEKHPDRPEVEGAVVIMEPSTGKVLAMSGGYSYEHSKFNRATQAWRQPGSAFKPFVYLTALEKGYSPATVLSDEPIELPLFFHRPNGPVWAPENYSGLFYGKTTLREGLEHSLNVLTVHLGHDLGITPIKALAEQFALPTTGERELSMVLGTKETNLLTLTNAYAMLANGGRKITPVLTERIYNQNGELLFTPDTFHCEGCAVERAGQEIAPAPPVIMPATEQAASPASVFQLTSILQGVVERGTAKKARDLGIAFAGKTGTSDKSRDAWFIGYTPDIVIGVYVGFDTPRSLGTKETGGSVALPIFMDIISHVYKDTRPTPFTVPSELVQVDIDLKTGLLPSPATPRGRIIREYFKQGQVPTRQANAPSPFVKITPDGLPAEEDVVSPFGGGIY